MGYGLEEFIYGTRIVPSRLVAGEVNPSCLHHQRQDILLIISWLLSSISARINDKGWYSDSGATNHVTNDFNNLSRGTDYHGNQKIHMGNGKGIYIKHNDKSFIFPSNNPHSFSLNNVLHVPLITKNLLSISHFCQDSNVSFEFHPSSYFVKDQVTKEIFFQGTLHKELYRLNYYVAATKPSGPTPHTFISETSP
ncbi:hypothetical protein UlMin_033289 [Ulmus minor]